jgi:hypothetical protein
MTAFDWKEFFETLGLLFGYCLALRLYLAQPWRIFRKSPAIVLAALLLNTFLMTGVAAGAITLGVLVFTRQLNSREAVMMGSAGLLLGIFFLFRAPVQRRYAALSDEPAHLPR